MTKLGRVDSSGRPSVLLDLQILRYFAAMLVVGDHALISVINRQLLPSSLLDSAYFLGWFGVAVFFVTSGFIMYHTSQADFGNTAGVKRFAKRRIARVVPLYWIATVLAAFTISEHISTSRLVMSFLFVPYSDQPSGQFRPIFGLGWTLNYEVFFYIAFCLAMFFSSTRGLLLLVGFFATLVATAAILEANLSNIYPLNFYGNGIIILFLMGVVIARVRHQIAERPTKIPLAGNLYIAVCLILIASAVLCFEAINATFPLSGLQFSLFSLFAALCVVACSVRKGRSTSRPRNVLERLGDGSYSIYLFHLFVLGAINTIWWRIFNHTSLPILAAYGLVVLISVSVAGVVLFKFLEVPLTRLARNLLEAREPSSFGRERRDA